MDMVGRLDKHLILQGIGSSSIWRSEIERRNAAVGLPITLQDDSYLPTDASSFYLHGVPILSAFTGAHSEYHTPRDTPETLNYEGAAQVARFMGLVAQALAASDSPPDYVQQSVKQTTTGGRLRAYLGTIPDYAEEVKGVHAQRRRQRRPRRQSRRQVARRDRGAGRQEDRKHLRLHARDRGLEDRRAGEDGRSSATASDVEVEVTPQSRD